MHFGFLSFPGHGHVNPTLPLVEELVRRGHRVSYAVQQQFAAAVECAGATVIPLPGTGIPAMSGFDLGSGGMAERLGGMAERLGGMVEDALAAYTPVVEAWTADPVAAVCFDKMVMTAPMVVEKLGVPGIALNPTYAGNDEFEPRREMFRQLPVDQRSREAAASMQSAMESLRGTLAEFAERHGVTPPRPLEATPAELNLVFIPRRLQPLSDTFDDSFVFVGPDLGARADVDWRPRLADRPLLFISLGTAFNDQPEFFRTCLAAFGSGPWQVAMAIGEAVTVDDLGPLPANFEVRPYFPQPAVLRHAEVFVSHAGMNSALESLYSGVPLVAVPQMPEQAMNAYQVDDLGLGRALDPATVTAKVLRDAVTEVAADRTMRARVAAFRGELKAAGGATAAADAIEAHLQRADRPLSLSQG